MLTGAVLLFAILCISQSTVALPANRCDLSCFVQVRGKERCPQIEIWGRQMGEVKMLVDLRCPLTRNGPFRGLLSSSKHVICL
jgi:hypothetical protein